MLREQPNCFAIDLTPSPLRAITRISIACSWVNIDGTQKAVILAQVGHFYFGGVGQYYSGANIQARDHGGLVITLLGKGGSTRVGGGSREYWVGAVSALDEFRTKHAPRSLLEFVGTNVIMLAMA